MDNPYVSAVLSVFVCGLGQLNNGKILKGIILGALWIISLRLISGGIGLITMPIVWIYSVYSAYKEAVERNAYVDRTWHRFDEALNKYKGRWEK